MKGFANSLPLLLFLILLFTLSISIYFGNLTVQSKENLETASPTVPTVTASPTPDPAIVNDIQTILSFFKDWNSASTKTSEKPKNVDVDNEDWFKKWNDIADSEGKGNTQVFANVCPSCSNKSCANCASLGGGSGSSYKNRFSDFIASHGAGYRGQGVFVGGYGSNNNPTLSKLAEQTGSGLVDVTKTALGSATGLGLGAMVLAEEAGSGATGLLRDTASGATGLLRETGSGAVGLVKDLGSGVKDVLRSNPVQINMPQNSQTDMNVALGGQGVGVGAPVKGQVGSSAAYGSNRIDPYSYNGALVSKGSNFIPVTSDFSSFRK